LIQIIYILILSKNEITSKIFLFKELFLIKKLLNNEFLKQEQVSEYYLNRSNLQKDAYSKILNLSYAVYASI
jgi:hypothetical protein